MAKQAKKVGLDFEKLAINDLIVFAVFKIKEKGQDCDFSALTKECFGLSPKGLRLANCQNWPDTRKLDRPLRILKSRKMLKYSSSDFFTLTEQGEKRAKEISNVLLQKKLL